MHRAPGRPRRPTADPTCVDSNREADLGQDQRGTRRRTGARRARTTQSLAEIRFVLDADSTDLYDCNCRLRWLPDLYGDVEPFRHDVHGCTRHFRRE
ncbi:MAG: hypothetical protein RL385_242 [Pseudomonadota bacterium]|jgi:hypothetical protein